MTNQTRLFSLILLITISISMQDLINLPGYSSFHNKIVRSKCYKGVVKVANIKSFIDLKQKIDYNTIENSLRRTNNEPSGFVKQAKTSYFLSEIKKTRNRATFLFKTEFDLIINPTSDIYNSNNIKQDILSEYGRKVLSEEPELFDTKCGGNYLEKVKGTASLAFDLSFETSNYFEYVKLNFDLSNKFKDTNSNMTPEDLMMFIGEKNVKGHFFFRLLQIGGNKEEFIKLNSTMNKKGYIENTCQLGEELCKELLKMFVNYAVVKFPNQIHSGFVSLSNEEQNKKFDLFENVVPVSYKNINEYGIEVILKQQSGEYKENKHLFKVYFSECEYYHNRLSLIEESNKKYSFKDSIDRSIKKMKVSVDSNYEFFINNQNDIYNKLQNCYDEIKTCDQVNQMIKERYIHFNRINDELKDKLSLFDMSNYKYVNLN